MGTDVTLITTAIKVTYTFFNGVLVNLYKELITVTFVQRKMKWISVLLQFQT